MSAEARALAILLLVALVFIALLYLLPSEFSLTRAEIEGDAPTTLMLTEER